MVPFKSLSVGDFLQILHSNFSSILTRFKDIAAFVLQHATVSHPPLFSPKFLHVLLGVGGWYLGYEERICWANCSCSSFPRFSTYRVAQLNWGQLCW